MYKLNTQKLVRQMTPPHRRLPIRKKVVEVLLTGLTLLWKSAEEQSRLDKLWAVYVPQRKVLEFHVNRVTGLTEGIVTVEISVIPGTSIPGYGFRFPANLNIDLVSAIYDLIRTLNITNWYETRY